MVGYVNGKIPQHSQAGGSATLTPWCQAISCDASSMGHSWLIQQPSQCLCQWGRWVQNQGVDNAGSALQVVFTLAH